MVTNQIWPDERLSSGRQVSKRCKVGVLLLTTPARSL